MRRLFASVLVASAADIGCVAGHLNLPTGPGIPRSDFVALFNQAATGCRDVRTITADLSLSGRTEGQRLRGRVQAGLAAPAAVRLEAPAPFGAPLFILAAPNERGTLLLPRDRRVVRDAAVRDIVNALAGIELGAADLRALLSGCVLPDPRPQAGRQYPGGWAAIDLQDGGIAWLRQMSGHWRLAAGEHAGLRVEFGGYGPSTAETPRQLRLSTVPPSRALEVDIRISLTQVELNVPLGAEVFTVTIPPETTPITLEELRGNGPLSGP